MATPISHQRYGPTTGSSTGWLGIAVAALAAVGTPVSDPDTSGFLIGALAATVGLLIWMVMLRPCVLVRPSGTVELRNVISSWIVPLAAITGVQVRAVTRVETEGGRYDGLGVGRPMKDFRRSRRGKVDPLETAARESSIPAAHTPGLEADLMVAQVLHAADRARADGLVAGPVRRVWALPELGVLGVLVLATVALALV